VQFQRSAFDFLVGIDPKEPEVVDEAFLDFRFLRAEASFSL
jgi:hypothetical protein